MRSGSAWLLTLAGAACSNALTLEKRASPAVFAMPMARDQSTSGHLSKRSSKFFSADLRNEEVDYISYVANMTLGTPPQSLLFYLDTMGNGCWVEGVDGTVCDELYKDASSCGGYGAYNRSASSTVKSIGDDFNYDDSGEIMTGDFVTDTLSMPGGAFKLDDMKMGVLNTEQIGDNTLGLGYGNASSISLTQKLADAGVINSPAFSLWDQTILFGGVDKSKYNGSLYTFPIVNGSDLTKGLRINMSSISINGSPEASKDFPLDAAFDIALDRTYVPKSVAQALNAQIGNTSIPDEHGQVNFSCKAVNENSTIEFTFGDLKYQFYLQSFVSQERDDQTLSWTEGDETCYFSILENVSFQNEGSIVLGANFISQVYAVFDLGNDEISLAQRSVNLSPYTLTNDISSDDIVEITSGKNSVPGTKNGSTNSAHSAGTHINKSMAMSALVVACAMLIIAF